MKESQNKKKKGEQIRKIQEMKGEKPSFPPPKPTRPIRKDYGEKPKRKPPEPTPPPPQNNDK